MTTYKTYDEILTGEHSDRDAMDYAVDMEWSGVETNEDTISHARRVGSVGPVGVYYDFCGDYYFFTDESS